MEFLMFNHNLFIIGALHRASRITYALTIWFVNWTISIKSTTSFYVLVSLRPLPRHLQDLSKYHNFFILCTKPMSSLGIEAISISGTISDSNGSSPRTVSNIFFFLDKIYPSFNSTFKCTISARLKTMDLCDLQCIIMKTYYQNHANRLLKIL